MRCRLALPCGRGEENVKLLKKRKIAGEHPIAPYSAEGGGVFRLKHKGISFEETKENRTVPLHRGGVFKKAENCQGRQQARPRHPRPSL